MYKDTHTLSMRGRGAVVHKYQRVKVPPLRNWNSRDKGSRTSKYLVQLIYCRLATEGKIRFRFAAPVHCSGVVDNLVFQSQTLQQKRSQFCLNFNIYARAEHLNKRLFVTHSLPLFKIFVHLVTKVGDVDKGSVSRLQREAIEPSTYLTP